jgi:hypothetical protein
MNLFKGFSFHSLPRGTTAILTIMLLLLIPLLAMADQVVNNIDTTIDPTRESVTITTGGSVSVGFYIQPTTGGGDANGCNSTGAAPATVNLSVPADVTTSAPSLIFTGCGVTQSVSFSSSTVGDYTISISSVTGGKTGSLWDTAPADFILHVLPPSDTTPPVITPNVSGTLGSNGWYTSDVTVTWTVSDPESSISSSTGCGSTTISADTGGTTLTCSATSAGGTNSQSVTIMRDATPPSASAAASPGPNGSGWNNLPVVVSFNGTDSLSGIASCDLPVVLSSEGAGQSASGTCTDNAGNTSSSATASGINIDLAPPTANASASPAANANGWNNTPVVVSFSGTDSLSGIDFCSAPVSLNSEGAGQSASGTCTDKAGNTSSSATASGINIDLTAPTINCPAADGVWHNSDVSINCTANDGLSGLVPADTSFSLTTSVPIGTETANASTNTRTISDLAGNSANAGPVANNKVDKKGPTVTCGATPTFTLNQAGATVSATVTDGGSGAAASPVSVSGVDTSSVGSHSVNLTGSDNVGNSTTVGCSYQVIYVWAGFFSPVDNEPTFNVVKAGSAIPIKFSLGGNFGLNIIVGGPGSGSQACNVTATADAIEDTVTAGNSSLSYDATTGQYVYVWKTDKSWANSCRRFVFTLNDGTTHEAFFKFTR